MTSTVFLCTLGETDTLFSLTQRGLAWDRHVVRAAINHHVSFDTDATYNRVDVSGSTFDTKEYGVRLNTNFSTRLTSNMFVQWNNQSKIANLNFRIHYIPKIGSDIFIVYNHLFDGMRDYHTSYNTVVTKVAYQFTF